MNGTGNVRGRSQVQGGLGRGRGYYRWNNYNGVTPKHKVMQSDLGNHVF